VKTCWHSGSHGPHVGVKHAGIEVVMVAMVCLLVWSYVVTMVPVLVWSYVVAMVPVLVWSHAGTVVAMVYMLELPQLMDITSTSSWCAQGQLVYLQYR